MASQPGARTAREALNRAWGRMEQGAVAPALDESNMGVMVVRRR